MKKVGNSQEILALTEQPGWDVLKQYFDNGHETFKKMIWSQLMAGTEASTLQREIDYARGAHDIARALIRYPDTVTANLEVVIQRLYRAHLSELAEESILDSPYIDTTEEVK